MPITYEACVTSVAQARAAQNAGADRLELCARLSTGGLTPPMDRLVAVRNAVEIPVQVMIRTRPGAFTCSMAELVRMADAIAAARRAGADGVVLGVLGSDDTVDLPAMRRLMRAARGLPVTFHRAFDAVPDQLRALEELIALGVRRVLTSGGAGTAREGAPRLRRLVRAAGGRIGIIAAGTVRPGNVRALIAATGVGEVHAHLRHARTMRAMARAVHPRRSPRGAG